MRSIELFAGAGGLAAGFSHAGFEHEAIIELNDSACGTLKANAESVFKVSTHVIQNKDIRTLSFNSYASPISIVTGGPPCQPFSIAGKHEGRNDNRDLFPEAARAIKEIRPSAFVFENVTGLVRKGFSHYFSYILLTLQHPDLIRSTGESWEDHKSRLEQHHSAMPQGGVYNVTFDVLNAANFGVPQVRKRLFIVGFRSDIGAKWSFPQPTHSQQALLHSQWVTGEYWDRHRIARARIPQITDKNAVAVDRLANLELDGDIVPWRTIRDAFVGLPDPLSNNQNLFSNHAYRPGARTYKGHTGSSLDEPAKTIKAGQHGVPGGENILRLSTGEVRYFTIREVARLQTFPDEYILHGSWTQMVKQLGNAVPVRLAHAIASSVFDALSNGKPLSSPK